MRGTEERDRESGTGRLAETEGMPVGVGLLNLSSMALANDSVAPSSSSVTAACF
jgi:hypothetical protein